MIACTVLLGCGRYGFTAGLAAEGTVDGALVADAGPPADAAAACTGSCVAAYLFDGDFDDLRGRHPATARGTLGFGLGADGTQALRFPPTAGPYLYVPRSPDFSLAQGEIKLALEVDPGPRAAGILSRDAAGKGDGDFAMIVAVDGRLAVRLQTAAVTATTRCARTRRSRTAPGIRSSSTSAPASPGW